MAYGKIDCSTATDNTVVAAVPGRKIRVQNYTAVSAGSVLITWKSGTTAVSGPMSLIAGVGLSPAAGGPNGNGIDGVLETNGGEALVLTLSGAVQVSGHLRYEVI